MNSVVLAVIARDEARCIVRCLDSMRVWVDRMLVLDTGSQDATVELSRAAGAEVHHHRWCDDFSEARNRALELADATWCIMLDADEWLIQGGPVLASLRDVAADFAGQLCVDSEFDSDDGVGVAPSWLARVAPRGARFAGSIHEQLAPGLQRRRLDVRVGHDGYRKARQSAKAGRNERLLRRALELNPSDPYWHYQLGKDLESTARYVSAAEHYECALTSGSESQPWRHDLVLRVMFCWKRCGQFARAVDLGHVHTSLRDASPDYHFVLGDVLLDWAIAEPARAPQLLPRIEAAWLRCLELGEQPDREGAVRGRGSFLAAKNLAAFHTGMGRPDAAAEFRRLEASWRARLTMD